VEWKESDDCPKDAEKQRKKTRDIQGHLTIFDVLIIAVVMSLLKPLNP
jgi:hypothetical protein